MKEVSTCFEHVMRVDIETVIDIVLGYVKTWKMKGRMSPEINSFATEFLASILSFCTELFFDARKTMGWLQKLVYLGY